MSPLAVTGFTGGVVLTGGADTRKIDEMLAADGMEIGARGALVSATGRSDVVMLIDQNTPARPVRALHGLVTTSGFDYVATLAVTEGQLPGGVMAYLVATFARSGQASPVVADAGTFVALAPDADVGAPCPVLVDGLWVTAATVQGPQTFLLNTAATPTSYNVFFVNLGAREGTAPRSAPGCYVVVVDPSVPGAFQLFPIGKFDALGTGPFGSYAVATGTGAGPAAYGTFSQQLFFRGIVSFNGYLFGWGFESNDAAHGDGPCRVMFSNLGLPTMFGYDANAPKPPAAATDRPFVDSDAIVLGSAGEVIRAALVVLGKLWFGTNRGLHFIQGYGRDSFLTNGAIPVMKAYNAVGPNALLEGPDRLLYGVGDQGLWRYDGMGLPEPLFERLVDFRGRSPGWWDLLWTDPSRAAGVPGRTNTDLVWTAVDWARQQVLVGIPWCDATAGGGAGGDTVVIKYHVRTGGFTRQVFPDVQLTAAGYFRQDGHERETRYLGTATPGAVTVQDAGAPTSATLPTPLPAVTFGPYVPFGPDGQGVVRRAYLTLAWASASALPLAFAVAATVDDSPLDAYTLTLGPTAPDAPVTGDVWLDTSQTDASLGNAGVSATVRAVGGYLGKTYVAGTWTLLAGLGMTGTRATIPLPLARRTGTRYTLALTTQTAGGRFEIEGLGLEPGAGVPNV